MGLTKLLRGWRRAPPAAPAPPRRTGPIRATCRVVNDHDVMADYPGAVTRTVRAFDWHDGALPGEDRTLGVFEMDGPIVMPGYKPVDTARGIVIANHFYQNMFSGPNKDLLLSAEGQSIDIDIDDAEVLDGRVAVIGGIYAPNYFHALMQWFARLALIEALAPATFNDPAVRFMLDREGMDEPFRGMIAAFGVPEERVVWTTHDRNYRIERAVVSSFVHEGDICADLNEIVASRIRSVLGIERRQRGTRRIWISREHIDTPRRRIANIDDVAPLLDTHGFERVALEHLSFADQVRLMSDAEVVSGSHGAGYANMIFTPPDCRYAIVEKDFARYMGIDRLFANIARSRGQTVEVVPADTIRLPGVDYSDFVTIHQADAVVDVPTLADVLARLAPGRGTG